MSDVGQISDGYHTFDELYEMRHVLFCALSRYIGKDYFSWKSRKHSDGTMFTEYFIAGVEDLEQHQLVTFHLPLVYWDACGGVELDNAPEWNGDTWKDYKKRLLFNV